MRLHSPFLFSSCPRVIRLKMWPVLAQMSVSKSFTNAHSTPSPLSSSIIPLPGRGFAVRALVLACVTSHLVDTTPLSLPANALLSQAGRRV